MGLRSRSGLDAVQIPALAVVAAVTSLAVVAAAVGVTHAVTDTTVPGHSYGHTHPQAAINGFLTERASARPSMSRYP
jgi:hypothetical protein